MIKILYIIFILYNSPTIEIHLEETEYESWIKEVGEIDVISIDTILIDSNKIKKDFLPYE